MQQTRLYKLFLLFLLYFSQGLPFGFQATALPVYLRTQNVSLVAIGFLGALSVPWMLKALWAPLVDRYYSTTFGRRKSWIIPLQLLLVLTIFFAAFIPAGESLGLLLLAVFFMNLFAATQDIAVDGLAVDLLRENELGLGNAVQVVGYRIGMIVSGGLLVWFASSFGWSGLFVAMAIGAALPLLFIITYRETQNTVNRTSEKIDWSVFWGHLRDTFRVERAWWVIAYIATYKIGEWMVDVMFKPFLIDSGIEAGKIGLWIGTYGTGAAIIGSLIGGVVATRMNLVKAVAIVAFLRTIPLAFQWYISVGHLDETMIIASTMVEHLFAGMLTTTMFAFMMSRVDARIGATHYTILASIEVIGKSPGAWASGPLAQACGYSFVFGLGTILSLLPLVLLKYVRPVKEPLK